MDELAAARFNLFWYLSLATPVVIMFLATVFRKKVYLYLGYAIAIPSTYLLSNLAVQEKWQLRAALADTPEELRYATADGANLVFTAFLLAPAESVLATLIWGYVGWKLWGRLRRGSSKDTA